MASSISISVSASSSAQPVGITSLTTSTENASDSTSTLCDKNGNNCESKNFGTGNNIKLNGFKVGEKDYQILKLVDSAKFRRVDNAEVSGERQIYFLESGSNGNVKSSEITTMEDAVRSDFINGGTDNVFANQGGINKNNIERVDFTIDGGLFVRENFVNDAGFLLLERGGNDPFKIAAITAVDSDGNPTAFGSLTSIPKSTWGESHINIKTKVIQNDANWDNPKVTNKELGSQKIHGIFVSVASLGINSGQTVYGYALFPNDITTTDNSDLVNLTNFPTDTSSDSGEGGLDLISSGGLFIPRNAVAADVFDEDSDGDGIPNEEELGDNQDGSVDDTDGDGIPDYQDLDSDNNGILDKDEHIGSPTRTGADPNSTNPLDYDTDGDGIFDYQDFDDDGDNIVDVMELYPLGVIDTASPKAANNYPNPPVAGIGSNSQYATPLDSDLDEIPDYHDTDSDDDTIPDRIEKGNDVLSSFPVNSEPSVSLDANFANLLTTDNIPDYLDNDSDGDGIEDSVEVGNNPNSPLNSDDDAINAYDYKDIDSDNDGIPDFIEAGNGNDASLDTDDDGLPNYRDLDSDGDLIPDSVEAIDDDDNTSVPEFIYEPINTDQGDTISGDGDENPDYLDLDSDDDGLVDQIEAGADPNNPVDLDDDGVPEYRQQAFAD